MVAEKMSKNCKSLLFCHTLYTGNKTECRKNDTKKVTETNWLLSINLWR